MEMIGTLEFYLTLLIIVIFYRDINAAETAKEGETTKSVTNTVDGMWTKFGEWGECKELELKRTRTRNCTSPAPSGDPMGKDCDGDDSEEKNCEVCDVKPSPCNNGTCKGDKDNEKGYKCDCKKGFIGDKCEKAATVCEPDNPCKHDGKCAVNATEPSKADCTCESDYTGDTCEIPTTVCVPTNPCKNGGKCAVGTVEPITAICTCVGEFTGATCEEQKNRQKRYGKCDRQGHDRCTCRRREPPKWNRNNRRSANSNDSRYCHKSFTFQLGGLSSKLGQKQSPILEAFIF